MLNGQAAVIVNGKFAQFGGRMMVQVSEMILGQFVENFRQTALTLPAPAGSAAGQSGAASTTASDAPKIAKEINGLAIFWQLIKGWWQGLFGSRG